MCYVYLMYVQCALTYFDVHLAMEYPTECIFPCILDVMQAHDTLVTHQKYVCKESYLLYFFVCVCESLTCSEHFIPFPIRFTCGGYKYNMVVLP